MGGSGVRYSESDLSKLREEAQGRLDRSRLDADVNAFLQHELIDINSRDTDKVNDRLNEVEEALAGTLREFDRVLFGGSVAKHTYVDGLSDIDSIIVLDPKAAGQDTPEQVQHKVEEILRRRLDLKDVKRIRVGQLAVTIEYKDGMELQLLPGVERGDSVAISSPSGKSWTPINPREFAEKLTLLNAKQGQSVVPAVKLAKAIIAENVPEDSRPSGYHVEALAVAAFDGYDGPRTPKAMVQRLFEVASTAVLRPISDVTGQSRYVDEALGAADSTPRHALARRLKQIARRVEQASSAAEWRSLLGD